MNLKQRFLTQSILILIVTIFITVCLGLAYDYFYNLLNESHVGGVGQTAVVVIENNDVIYNSNDFTMLQIKEMLMNISIENDYYEYENIRYSINDEMFTTQDGGNYRIITLNQIIDISNYYRSFITFVFISFVIIFIISSLIVQKQNMNNIIMPITDLTSEMEKLRIGELETTITDKGYGEVRELGSAIEQL
jgi:methyl-accepting chemotaxis protein